MKKVLAAALSLGLIGTTLPAPVQANDDWGGGQSKIKHVLLISIDGMHVVDYLNCSKGISTVNNGAPYCPNLAELSENGVSYRDTSTSKPSDSFPGLTAIVTGALPRTTGIYYDVAYDRVYAPPTITTGNGLAGGTCTKKQANGTTSEYEEGIDLDKTKVNGGAPGAGLTDGSVASIDPNKLIRDPFNNCAPVYPWDFVRTNSIFSVIHYAGGYVAWSDKHPAYSSVAGHGTGGKTLDDFYAPEINSNVVPLPVTTVDGVNCTTGLDQNSDLTAWTNSFVNIKCYDTLKVNAVLNWINGKTHDGSKNAPRPNLFGMNFQTVSVGQKLIQSQVGLTGGYLDSTGTPSPSLLGEIEFTDAAIGSMVQALKKNGIYESTLIIITAKHGQSPVDSARYLGISNSTGDPITTSPATILDKQGYPGSTSCLPFSESPSNPTGIGPTEDDVSLIWLNSNCTTDSAVALLRSTSPTTNNIAGIGEIFSDSIITTYFNKPGIPPNGDSRTPDIVVTPNIGVTYSGSKAKLAEHGGFSRDDTNVMILLSNPSFQAKTVTTTVGTVQVAPTILKALGLNPSALDGVKIEGTEVLPGVQF